MAITLRSTKGHELTHAELDGNFTDLDLRLQTVETQSYNVSINRFDYTADSGDTIFTGADDNSNVLAFDSSSTQVYLNGLLLNPSLDYTLSTKNTVTTTAGIDSDHLVTITTITVT